MRTLITAFALAVLLPVTVQAQEQEQDPPQGHRHGQGMQQGMQHGGMQGGMGMGMGMAMMRAHPGPGMILRLRESLELSEEQVERLTAMHEEAHEGMQAHMEQAREARSRAHEIMMGEDPDMDAFGEALQEAATHRVQAQQAMARVHLEAGEVLSDDQRQLLHTITEAMHELHGDGDSQPQRGQRMRMHRRGGATL